MLMAIHQEWSNVDLKSDCLVLVSALAHNSLDGSTIGRIVEDYKDYMAGISSLTVRHVYREVNDVAHRLCHTPNSRSILYINMIPKFEL